MLLMLLLQLLLDNDVGHKFVSLLLLLILLPPPPLLLLIVDPPPRHLVPPLRDFVANDCVETV